MVQSIDSQQLSALDKQIHTLVARCQAWDNRLTQKENKSFRFEIHLFNQSSLTLLGYCKQLQVTFQHLKYVIDKEMPATIVNYECEKLINQFSALLNIVNHLDQGNADVLYKRFSTPQEEVYQQLQRQYQYEKRLLAMIDEENTQYQNAVSITNKERHKVRAAALKVRYQKCNEFTQHLEFKMESFTNE